MIYRRQFWQLVVLFGRNYSNFIKYPSTYNKCGVFDGNNFVIDQIWQECDPYEDFFVNCFEATVVEWVNINIFDVSNT